MGQRGARLPIMAERIATARGSGYDSPAMGDERRWAARYQFLDELWRGRDRIVCDRELEAALHAGAEGSLAELLARLIPGDAGGDRAWVALHNDRRAASFARERSGTVFVAMDEAAEIASDEGWQVALVHLGSSDNPAGPSTRADLLGPGVESFLEVLGERLEDDAERSVVLSLPCGSNEDLSYELLTELVEELFGDGRIYGLTRPGMAAFYDFGPVLESDAEADGEDQAAADIEVDNSLGSESPRFEVFLAVVGASVPGEGVTFIELPAARSEPRGSGGAGGAGGAASGDDELAAVRVQLAEAQRRGDLQAIERQSLLEKLEQAEDRIASLEEQLDDASARASGAESSAAGPATAEGPRIDEVLAREQTLRWELQRLRGEIERLEARPVEELEAEVASLRAELEQTRTELDELTSGLDELGHDDQGDDGDDEDQDEDDGDLSLLLDQLDQLEAADEPSPAQIREWRRARSKLDHLLRKLERGGRLSALELHRQLASLKKLL
jgi:hypothetical protein